MRRSRSTPASIELGWFCLRTGDRVGLLGFDERVRQWAEPAGGMHTFQRLQAMSAEIDYRHVETNYTLTLAELSTRLRRRSLVVLFTDFLDTMTAELMIDNVARLARRHLVLGCRLCFERPVTGPIALGYAAHQGLGQFVAVG